MDNKAIEQLLKERELMRDFVQHPGAKLLAARLRKTSREALKRQLDSDPYTDPDKIKQNQQLRYVLNIMLPGIIEGICNFDPSTPDKKIHPKKRFSILEWFR